MYTKLVTNESLESKTRNGNVLLYFTASWCGPCKQMKPILRKLAEERMVTVVEIDLDVHKDLADTHNVQSIPLIKYVVDSGARVAWTSIGIVTRDEIVSHVS